jgi:hypothetical protein
MSGLDVEHAPDGSEPAFDGHRQPPAHQDSPAEDELQDSELRAEIELVADLVVAASTSDVPLSHSEIDRALGLRA